MINDKIKVGILDDHQIVIDGLMMLLSKHESIDVVKNMNFSSQLFDYLKDSEIDILLLDVQLSDESGLSVCRKLQKQYPQIKVIVLTMIDQISMFKKMFNAGAKGYLLKNVDEEKLISTILKVAKDDTVFDDQQEKVIQTILSKKNSNYISTPRLSMREKEILALIIDEHTTPDIAKKLFISQGTVITHRRNIISKLGVKNTAGVVRKALELGLL